MSRNIRVMSQHPKAAEVEKSLRRIRLLVTHNEGLRPLAGLFLLGEDVVCDDVAKAATDGVTRRYNADFMSKLTHPQRGFIVLHEIIHMMARHSHPYRQAMATAVKRQDTKEQALIRLAFDFVANGLIVDDPAFSPKGPVEMPPKTLYSPEFKGKSWIQVLKILRALPEQEMPEGESFDEHEFEMEAPEPNNLDREIAASEAMRRAMGKGTGGTSRSLYESSVRPLPWHELLRELYKNSVPRPDSRMSYSRPSRRGMSIGIPLPGALPTRSIGELLVVGDTSGSISAQELSAAAEQIGRIASVAPPDRLVLYWTDAEVSSSQVFLPKDYTSLKGKLKPTGFGGTDLPVAFDVAKKEGLRPVGAVVITDGYTPWGEPPPYPVWWVITTPSIEAPYGVTLHM